MLRRRILRAALPSPESQRIAAEMKAAEMNLGVQIANHALQMETISEKASALTQSY